MKLWLSQISLLYNKFLWSGLALLVILVAGTVGYWYIGEQQYSVLDALYMTVITVATIGYGEIVDLSHSPGGRVFTMFIAVAGIGVMSYMLTNFTALIVEGELVKPFKRREMEKVASNSRDHFIVCGLGGMGLHIINELRATKRPHVAVEVNRATADRIAETYKNEIVTEGDATDNETLLKAGIQHARGLFAVTGDDNQNLVISLTAKQLNPSARVVARCNDLKNSEKIKRVGAEAVVSTTFIGGLRMASEMVRPTVVSFLDIMMRDKDKNLRIEEIPVAHDLAGKSILSLNLKKHRGTLLLATRSGDAWTYNPADEYIIKPGDVLVLMTTPDEHQELERLIGHTRVNG